MTQQDIKSLPVYYKDGELYWSEVTSNRIKKDTIAGTLTEHGYRFVSINKKRVYVHRLIFFIFNGYYPKYIDHINGDRSDNRIENLRECTNSQNSANKNKLATNKSGYKGVHFVRSVGKYRAQITLDSKVKHLGYYETAEQASEKYNFEFTKHFKEFAKL
jgi:hypothetical protein